MNYKMRYDREDDVLMVWLNPKEQVDHAEQTGNVILHVNKAGAPVLLEVLNAQDFVLELVRAAMAVAPAESAAG